jgi:capsular polysaccharide biosynthesis protein
MSPDTGGSPQRRRDPPGSVTSRQDRRRTALTWKPTLRRLLIRFIPAAAQPYLRSTQFAVTRVVGRLMRMMPGSSVVVGPPRKIADSLSLYVRDRGGLGDFYVELEAATVVQRTAPRTAAGAVDTAFLAEMSRRLPSAGYAVINGGRVLTATGAVVGPDDHLIADVSQTFLTADPRENIQLITPKLPRVTNRAGLVGVLTVYRSDIYYHWLFDTLPRLHLLQSSRLPVDAFVVPQRTSFQRDAVSMLGLDQKRLVSDGSLHLRAESLVVPSLPGDPGNPPAWACSFLRASFLDSSRKVAGRTRLFVSRARSASRRVLNEDRLLDVLRPLGFRSIYLEELSFRDQIDAFNDAEIIVSPHGSGLANLVFCRAGAQVIELFSPNYVNVLYWTLSNQVQLDYSYILGSAPVTRAAHRGRHVHEDIVVDVQAVEAMVRSAISR